MPPPSESGKILVIGLSRTGTLTLTGALRILGFQCAHWADHMAHAKAIERWLEGEPDPEWLADYAAAADIPVPTFFRELDRYYPGPRFILTTRDTEGWLASYRAHVHRSSPDELDELGLKLIHATSGKQSGSWATALVCCSTRHCGA